jgi:hypothetical protein
MEATGIHGETNGEIKTAEQVACSAVGYLVNRIVASPVCDASLQIVQRASGGGD